MQLKGLLCRP